MSATFPFAVQAWQIQCQDLRPALVLDLRPPERFARGHLPGAHSLPYNRFQTEALDLVADADSVLVVDPAGARAAEMATWLRARGVAAGYLEGGMATWTGDLERP